MDLGGDLGRNLGWDPGWNPGWNLRLALCSVLLLGTCGGAPREPGSDLLSCERLAFVPRGSVTPFPDVLCAAGTDLLVDRFEVTRELWLSVVEASGADLGGLDQRLGQDWGEGPGTLPAVGMDHDEARRFARLRGMRLPTVGEWMYVAAGSRAQYWPYGVSRETSVANTLEVGLGEAARGGTFPNGRSTGTDVYDLVGNVWEWVTPPLPRGVEPASWGGQGTSPFPLWAMGGSYLTRAQELYGLGVRRHFNAQGLEAGHRALDLGLRCAVEAEPYLWAHAGQWSDPALREHVVAVGRSWGPRAVGLLESLARRPGAPAAIAWLLEGARP